MKHYFIDHPYNPLTVMEFNFSPEIQSSNSGARYYDMYHFHTLFFVNGKVSLNVAICGTSVMIADWRFESKRIILQFVFSMFTTYVEAD